MDKNNELEVASDYCGVGAFDQALERLEVPFKKVFACDFDYFARLTYILNFGTEEDLVLAKSKEHKMFCDGMEFIILGKDAIPEMLNKKLLGLKYKKEIELCKKAILKAEKDVLEFDKKCKKLNIHVFEMENKKFDFSEAADNFATNFSFYYPFNVYDREIPKYPLDIYMTSPPCQAFSLAGKRLGKADIKGILFFNSLEFIAKNEPRFFMFENVKGLLSDDKTNKSAEFGNTFQEWINYLGGKSINGLPTIFPYEDSVPYHIYFKVLNAKEHGVPQNRERIFIIGIRDDEENNFQFPKTIPLEKRLKDVLQSNVDEKYFLSDEMVYKLIKENGKEFINQDTQASKVHDIENVFPTLCAGTHGYALGYIKELEILNRKKYNKYKKEQISDTITAGGTAGAHNRPLVLYNEIIQLNDPIHSNDRVYSEEGISPTLNTMQGGNRQPFVQVQEDYKILGYTRDSKGKVTSRHEKEIAGTITTSSGGGGSTDQFVMINSATQKGYEIAEEEDSINFSVPNSKTRRGRVGKGVSQTLDTSYSQGVLTKQRIRRLTPTECFRLMNFNPEMIEKTISSGLISDSQLYKQAGNSIVVEKLCLLIKKLLKLQ